MTYKEFCDLKANDPMENIFPKGTEPDEAMFILESTFTGHVTCDAWSDVAKGIILQCKKHPNTNFDDIHGLTAQGAVNLLKEELLGEDWYIGYPCGFSQYTTEVVGSILYRYGPKEKVPFLTRIRNFFK